MLLIAAVSLFVAAAPTAPVENLEDFACEECENVALVLDEEEEVLDSQEIVFDDNIELENGEASDIYSDEE